MIDCFEELSLHARGKLMCKQSGLRGMAALLACHGPSVSKSQANTTDARVAVTDQGKYLSGTGNKLVTDLGTLLDLQNVSIESGTIKASDGSKITFGISGPDVASLVSANSRASAEQLAAIGNILAAQDERKSKAEKDSPVPTDKTQLIGFLGALAIVGALAMKGKS